MSNRHYHDLAALEATLGKSLETFEDQELVTLSDRLFEKSSAWVAYLSQSSKDPDGSTAGSVELDESQDVNEMDDSNTFRARLERILSVAAHRLQMRLNSHVSASGNEIESGPDNGAHVSGNSTHQGGTITADQCAAIAERLYKAYYQAGLVAVEGPLLHCVAWNRSDKWLRRLVELLCNHSPLHWRSTALALSPLMRSRNWNCESVFPRLLDSLSNPSTITPVLDLANFTVHASLVKRHPASERVDFLVQLLSGVVARLGMMEEDPTRFGDNPEQIQLVLNDSIALCVALCDAVGLIGVDTAVGKLHQALELQHRRVQTEAAAALARMNIETGKSGLIKLASEPIARRRVLTYADELGFLDKIEDQYTTETALSESDLANWLSDPNQMGFPPHSMEMIDSRTLFWPSFDEPQSCFLYRFQYRLPQGDWSNIAMAGPLVHAFSSDLADLPVADIYAAFAGWQAEHNEIFEVAPDRWNSPQRRLAESFIDLLRKNHHDDVEPLWLGFFFGEACLVARSKVESSIGIAVTDGQELLWYPSSNRLRPLGPIEVYSIYKGRKMLRSFNSSDAFDEQEDLDSPSESDEN